jgi:Sulfotransferase domain
MTRTATSNVPPATRIAMWSGPRNISTAMMRSFEARGDSAVTDEPFYSAYLHRTGIDHPMREEVIASQSRDPSVVAAMLIGPVPDGKPIWYQKHMTLHMIEAVDRRWMAQVSNAFLIRDPAAVLASYASKRAEVTLADIGFVQQRELFEQVAERSGAPPPVIDAADVLAAPGRTLSALCEALKIPYTPAMLHWAPGRRATDGVWAPAWYAAVESSTGFAAPAPAKAPALSTQHLRLVEQAQPHYDALAKYRLS